MWTYYTRLVASDCVNNSWANKNSSPLVNSLNAVSALEIFYKTESDLIEISELVFLFFVY